jgi:hypothetical protein
MTNTIINTVDIGHRCYGTDFNMNRLAIRVVPKYSSSYIVYLDPEGTLIDRINIAGWKNINNRLPSLSANTSFPSGNMSQPTIQTHPLLSVGKLTVVLFVNSDVAPSMLSCGICACNSAVFIRLGRTNFTSAIEESIGCHRNKNNRI